MRIITRAEWGAKPPTTPLTPVSWPDGVDLWIHHAETAEAGTLAAGKAACRSIQAFHQGPERGWKDIGYAYLVDSAGNVYEGRGEHEAAHCPGHNHEPSVCMIGNYDHVDPSEKMRAAVYQLSDAIKAGDFRGHREGYPTDCPGDRGMAVMVNGPVPAGYRGSPPPAPPKDATLAQRLAFAGWGPKSIPITLDRLARKRFGTIPNPTDSATFRRLRGAGLGPASARLIIATNRETP